MRSRADVEGRVHRTCAAQLQDAAGKAAREDRGEIAVDLPADEQAAIRLQRQAFHLHLDDAADRRGEEAGVERAVRMELRHTTTRRAADIEKVAADDDAAVRPDDDIIHDSVRPCAGIEAAVQAAVRVQSRHAVAADAVDCSEPARDDQLAIRLACDGVHRQRIRTAAADEGRIEHPIRLQAADAIDRRGGDVGRAAHESQPPVRLHDDLTNGARIVQESMGEACVRRTGLADAGRDAAAAEDDAAADAAEREREALRAFRQGVGHDGNVHRLRRGIPIRPVHDRVHRGKVRRRGGGAVAGAKGDRDGPGGIVFPFQHHGQAAAGLVHIVGCLGKGNTRIVGQRHVDVLGGAGAPGAGDREVNARGGVIERTSDIERGIPRISAGRVDVDELARVLIVVAPDDVSAAADV